MGRLFLLLIVFDHCCFIFHKGIQILKIWILFTLRVLFLECSRMAGKNHLDNLVLSCRRVFYSVIGIPLVIF